VRDALRIGAAVVALVALALPAAALGQSGAPKLREDSDSGFPDKVFILELPESKALTASQVEVTENGQAVLATSLEAPGGSVSGAILLIDASNSMRGEPIEKAMAAARAFMAERAPDLPVAVIVYNPNVTVLTDFTTDAATLAKAVAETPPLALGTHIYDALLRAAELAKDRGLGRTTAVLLSDGNRRGVQTSPDVAIKALNEADVRVVAVGLRSPLYDENTLTGIANATGGVYLGSQTPEQLAATFAEISSRISNEYVLTYRSLLPADVEAKVRVDVAGFETPATTVYRTPAIDITPGGTFDRTWVDRAILSPWMLLFVVLAVIGLVVFAILTALDVRRRSLKRRMAQYVSVPTEEESRLRRAEVAATLAERAERRVGRHRWWQSFESDVELGGFSMSALSIAGWTIIGGLAASFVAALALGSPLGLLAGLAAPLVSRAIVKRRVSKTRKAFADQLPDNLEVLAGALRNGHSLVGAMSVTVESAAEPSKSEFRRVLQDEQLGVPMDQSIMVMAHRMRNPDVEQVAIVTRLQREAGGNTAEVLDRVVENVRGRMELMRLVNVLTAQARLSRLVLLALPFGVAIWFSVVNPGWLDPLFDTGIGRLFLVLWVVMVTSGTLIMRKIGKIEV
jgi:VWFA-related protein